jgi:hypothetical protein
MTVQAAKVVASAAKVKPVPVAIPKPVVITTESSKPKNGFLWSGLLLVIGAGLGYYGNDLYRDWSASS